MGFWRSLRKWWRWDGSPEADPFGNPDATADDDVPRDVHAHAAPEAELPEPADEHDG